jgi:AraC-like DNA-binding protein
VGDINYVNGAKTFSITYKKALNHHMPISHFHSTYEVYYLKSGKREFFIKDRTLVVDEGDIVIISPNILHRTTDAESPEHEKLIINIHESHMLSADGSYDPILRPLFEEEYLVIPCSFHDRISFEALASRMIKEILNKKSGYGMYAETLALQLLVLCCRYFQENAVKTPESPSPMHERISEIVRYINNHCTEEISLHLVAERFFISPYYLSRFFKEATGFTFVEYVNSVRVKEAKKLLEGSSLKVNLIARRVGFGRITHFGRVFRAVTGNAPLYYRKGK